MHQFPLNRRQFVTQATLLLGSTLASRFKPSHTPASPAKALSVQPARAVLERALGPHSDNFDLILEPSISDHPSFEYIASSGRVRIRATSVVALCRGAYAYLREHCGSMITWSSCHLDLPTRLPDAPATLVQCPYEQVQYLNPCTFGYTTAFWHWERWERELDWMALHGITMALALEGQESIWQRVWHGMGVTDAELERHFTGPAQLPWHRMGNINNFDGPLRQDWIDSHRLLQHRILDRMRELGITPIVPGFSGFVPQGLKRVHPELATFTEMWHSTEVPHLAKTFILDPRDGFMYAQIGRSFIEQYKKEFGPASYFLIDTFNELSIPVRAEHRNEDLALFARTVYEGIRAGDPEGIWVMQGWLLRDNQEFWDDTSLAAFLSGVPNDRMIVLDYSNDVLAYKKDAALHPLEGDVWRRNGSFHGKRWIDGMIGTFGGNNNLKGNLALFATQPIAAGASSDRGHLMGWSMNPEGIENNEVVYELLTDMGWRHNALDLDEWLKGYCLARYGACPSGMEEAWKLLRLSAYGHGSWSSRQAWQCRPSLEPAAVEVDSGLEFQKATLAFLSCAPTLADSTYYRNDLIELAVQATGGSVDRRFTEATAAHKAGNGVDRDRFFADGLQMLSLIDGLLHLREDRRLERWVGQARSWAATPDIASLYDISARRLVTYWGWPDLNDYGSRVWSGLTRDYYAGRWREFARALKAGQTPYFDEWEESWLAVPYQPSRPVTITDLPATVTHMLSVCRSWT